MRCCLFFIFCFVSCFEFAQSVRRVSPLPPLFEATPGLLAHDSFYGRNGNVVSSDGHEFAARQSVATGRPDAPAVTIAVLSVVFGLCCLLEGFVVIFIGVSIART